MFAFVFMIASGVIPFAVLLLMAEWYLRHLERHPMRKRFRLVQNLIRVCEIHSNTKASFHGLENIPDENDGGFLVIPNHQGKYDALAVMHAFPYPVSVLMEMKQSKKPLARQVIDLLEGERIDLERPRQQLRVIREIGTRIRDNAYKCIVFPEGGYTKNHNSIQEFHNGCLFSAFLARCPIVPVCLVDSYQSMNRNNIFKRVHPEIHILPVIPYEAYQDMSRQELAEYVQGKIEEKMIEVLTARGETYRPAEGSAPPGAHG